MYQNIFLNFILYPKKKHNYKTQTCSTCSSLPQWQLKVSLIKPLACQIHAGVPLFMSVSLVLTASLHLTHKWTRGAHYTHQSVQQLSHWHTKQPISGSVEDGCHGSTSRAMLPHDPRCDAAEPALSLCPALLLVRCYMETQNGTIQTSSTPPPFLAYRM